MPVTAAGSAVVSKVGVEGDFGHFWSSDDAQGMNIFLGY